MRPRFNQHGAEPIAHEAGPIVQSTSFGFPQNAVVSFRSKRRNARPGAASEQSTPSPVMQTWPDQSRGDSVRWMGLNRFPPHLWPGMMLRLSEFPSRKRDLRGNQITFEPPSRSFRGAMFTTLTKWHAKYTSAGPRKSQLCRHKARSQALQGKNRARWPPETGKEVHLSRNFRGSFTTYP